VSLYRYVGSRYTSEDEEKRETGNWNAEKCSRTKGRESREEEDLQGNKVEGRGREALWMGMGEK
jgi:hypothetical protein